MISGALAKRYAKALLGCASTPVLRDRFDENLQDAVVALRHPDELGAPVLNMLGSTRHPLEQRKKLARAVLDRLGTESAVKQFIIVLIDNGRIAGLEAIARGYRTLADAQANRVRATITSARALGAGESEKIKRALEAGTGLSVVLELRVDPELIGGVVTDIGGIRLDRSVRTQLDELKTTLVN